MTQQYDIHFCLISDQAAPNLLPILDNEFKPKQAIFFVSQKMKTKASYLADTFKSKNVQVDIQELKDEFDFQIMEDQFTDLVSRYENQNVALNVTCGTKLMSIAAANAFNLIEKPIFYVDTDNNRIVFISKDEKGNWILPKTLNANNDLETYLSAYGVSVLKKTSKVTNEKWIDIAITFTKNYEKYKNNIPLLNKHAKESEKTGMKNNFKVEIENKVRGVSSFKKLLEELKHNYNIIEYYDDSIEFKHLENKNYLSGSWLEEYTYHKIKDIKNIDDIGLNVEVGNSHYKLNRSSYSQENLGNSNEFDVVFISKNKLHIIECKTNLMTKNQESKTKSEDILYKLETLKDYGGLMTKKCLVSYFTVDEKVMNRAKELKIEIIQGTDLSPSQFKQKLQNWIGKR